MVSRKKTLQSNIAAIDPDDARLC